jgi:hypothetical protein
MNAMRPSLRKDTPMAKEAAAVTPPPVAPDRDPARAFDFWMGTWRVRHRRLRERLTGCEAWDEFSSTALVRPLPGGIGNEDEFHTDFWPGYVGMSFRFFNRATQTWAIYWADNQHGTLEPPVLGGFAGDIGTFEGNDVFRGQPIRVRFIWSRTATASPRWEQAFSTDGGVTWETNWTMDMERESE